MSLGGDDLKKTEGLPGAFPSDTPVTTPGVGTQQNTKPYPEHELGAHQNVAQAGGANNSSLNQNIAHTTAAGAGSTGSPADSDPDHLLHRAGTEGNAAGGTPATARDSAAQPTSTLASAANPLSGPAEADDNDGLGPNNAPNVTEDLKAVGSGAATAVTAAAIAARDAAIAAKDAAAPVVSSAAEQARQAAGYAAENVGPAASATSAQASNAAGYTMDTAGLAAKAASDQAKIAAFYAKDNAPAALGGGPTANTASPRDVAPEVPSQVKSSLAEAGEAPEAASSRRAVHDKGQVEGELLGYAREVDAEDEAARRAQEQFKKQQQQQGPVTKGPRPPAPGTLARLDSEPQTPGTGAAVVLGTETERSFPLGSVHEGTGPDAAETGQLGGANSSGGPMTTDGVRTGGVPQTSLGDGQSAAARRPAPAEDKVPVRASEEQTVGNGPGAYQKLSSGTPSGVGQ